MVCVDLVPQFLCCGQNSLKTSIVRTTIDADYSWGDGGEGSGQLMGLLDAIGGERRVSGDLGRRKEFGCVDASPDIEVPSATKLG